MRQHQNVLLVAPRFHGRSFWNFVDACELQGARTPSAPLGLITVAALLPDCWECRLVNRNTEELTDADLEWADMIMTGGMLPQWPDTLDVIALARERGIPVIVGGPHVTTSPESYQSADIRVLGEAEGIIESFISAWESGTREGVFEAPKFKVDVTKTPIPRFDLLKRSQYLYWGVQFARGCPFTCEFCDVIELHGRVPRTKTKDQMLAELDALYRLGYRGHLNWVDDNFIGNKKAVKAFLPHLIGWQKKHGYPFEFSTEASINLADDDALLALMREANFFTIFVGIESPDTDTLIATQKKQNTRRSLADSVQKILRAGIYVHAGFILGFDSEEGSVAEAMIACIEDTAIPVCLVGLLYASPNTQMTRRLAAEGRLFPDSYVKEMANPDTGDQCTAGLNFSTARPRREILADYRKVLQEIYSPAAFFRRTLKTALVLNRASFEIDKDQEQPTRLGPIPLRDLRLLWRLICRTAVRQPVAFLHFARVFATCVRHNPGSLAFVGASAGLYLHIGPFSRFVMRSLDAQIDEIDAGLFRSPLEATSDRTNAPEIPARAQGAMADASVVPEQAAERVHSAVVD